MAKVKVEGKVRINAYAVISRAVEEGVEYGWNRAHKHTDKPTRDGMITAIEDAVMLNLSELLIYDDDEEGEDEGAKKD